MTTPSNLCAACHHPLRTGLAWVTDAGWVCDRTDCDQIAQRLNDRKEATDMGNHAAVLYAAGKSVREVSLATGWGKQRIRKALVARGVPVRPNGAAVGRQRAEEIAYAGGWVRVGMIWKPTMQEAS